MKNDTNMHNVQVILLRELLFNLNLSYADLRKASGLESDHAKFHINRLVDMGLIERSTPSSYQLTQNGKELANRLDLESNAFESQPKVSVLLLIDRRREDGDTEYLVQQRLKATFYGFWGRFGGMVHWGESFEGAASRILTEETGLRGVFEFAFIFRKFDTVGDSADVQEDKVFFMMHATSVSGNLVEEFEGGRNQWMTRAEIESQDKYFKSATEFIDLQERGQPYYSGTYSFSPDEY